MLQTAFGIPIVTMAIVDLANGRNIQTSPFLVVFFVGCAFSLVLHCFSDLDHKSKSWTNEEKASAFSGKYTRSKNMVRSFSTNVMNGGKVTSQINTKSIRKL